MTCESLHVNKAMTMVENVIEAFWWGPEQAPGAAFTCWLQAVRVWGYEHKVVFLDSVHAQALGPGSRSRRARMYVIFWQSRLRSPDFDNSTATPPPTPSSSPPYGPRPKRSSGTGRCPCWRTGRCRWWRPRAANCSPDGTATSTPPPV